MKEPKKWTRPRLYWSPTASIDLIIIYPDRRPAERTSLSRGIFVTTDSFWLSRLESKIIESEPCWYRKEMSPRKQRKEMFKYAKANKFKRYFIGEL